MNIKHLSALPGSGKTKAIIVYILRLINILQRITYVVPTTILCDSIKERMVEAGIDPDSIIIINSNTIPQSKSVSDALIDEFNYRTHKIIIITSQLLASSPSIVLDEDLLIIDEEIKGYEMNRTVVQMPYSKMFWKDHIDYIPTVYPDLQKLRLINQSTLNPEDIAYKGFKYLIDNLKEPNIDMFVFTEDMNKLNKSIQNLDNEEYDPENQYKNAVSLIKVLNPVIFKDCSEVIYLGSNIDKLFSSLIYKSKLYNVTFTESSLTSELGFTEYSPEVEINYFYGNDSEDDASLGNYKLSKHPELASTITTWINNELTDPYLLLDWNYDNESKTPNFNSNAIKLPKTSHGLNDPHWRSINTVVCCSNFRPGKVENKFLEILGYPRMSGDVARHVDMIIQGIARSQLRDNIPDSKITVYIHDEFTAMAIARAIGKWTNINHIDINLEKVTYTRSRTSKTKEEKDLTKKIDNKINYLKSKAKKGTITPKEKKKLEVLIAAKKLRKQK